MSDPSPLGSPEERPKSRFPRWVYDQGTEPDPRFSLANERTFLAWIRTSLALFAAGVALEALALSMAPRLRFIAAVVLVTTGLLAAFQSWFGWARTERALRRKRALPSPGLTPFLTVGVVLAGVLVLVGLP